MRSSRYCTRSRVAGATSVRPLTTLDTVATDTPAEDATSAKVVRGRMRALEPAMSDLPADALCGADGHRRVEDAVGADDPRLAGEAHDGPARQVAGRAADHDDDVTGLDDASQVTP